MTVQNVTILNFTLKGDRDYIQGGDIFNAVIDQFTDQELKDIRLNIHGFMKNKKASFKLYNTKPNDQAVICKGSLKLNGAKHWFEVEEDKTAPPSERSETYDETLTTGNCVIKDNSITLNGGAHYSFIETLISMLKFLLNKTSPLEDMKWIFTGIELKETENNCDNLCIEIKHNFQNKLVKSAIFRNDEPIGTIYFSSIKAQALT